MIWVIEYEMQLVSFWDASPEKKEEKWLLSSLVGLFCLLGKMCYWDIAPLSILIYCLSHVIYTSINLNQHDLLFSTNISELSSVFRINSVNRLIFQLEDDLLCCVLYSYYTLERLEMSTRSLASQSQHWLSSLSAAANYKRWHRKMCYIFS